MLIGLFIKCCLRTNFQDQMDKEYLIKISRSAILVACDVYHGF